MDPDAVTIRKGPALIFERLRKNTGGKHALQKLLKDFRFGVDVERAVFLPRFTGLELIFFATTSIYFEGEVGEILGERNFTKNPWPNLQKMVAGVVIDDEGLPLCYEMWAGKKLAARNRAEAYAAKCSRLSAWQCRRQSVKFNVRIL